MQQEYKIMSIVVVYVNFYTILQSKEVIAKIKFKRLNQLNILYQQELNEE